MAVTMVTMGTAMAMAATPVTLHTDKMATEPSRDTECTADRTVDTVSDNTHRTMTR